MSGLTVVFLCFVTSGWSAPLPTSHMSKSVARMTSTFLYFAYGSNLLRERILVKNRTAVFKCIARLDVSVDVD